MIERAFPVVFARQVDVATLERLMRGGVDWTLVSARYTDIGGFTPDAAVRPAGWADHLGDDSAEPLNIPSIAWWWRHDPVAGRSSPGDGNGVEVRSDALAP
jgi:selina-4(15),7(11)-diene synthase